MIYLTCDVHNQSLNMSYRSYHDKSELQVTQEFIKLLEKYNVKSTMFLTGKCFTEEWEDARPICDHPLVQIGGHNYYCFEPAIVHRLWGKLTRNFSGPRIYQRHDIKKTQEVIFQRTGKRATAWRNHTLLHGPNTESILAELGFKICADEVRASANGPEWHKDGIHNFPVNIIPDYDHIYHADRTEAWVKAWVNEWNWSDDFGSESYYIEQWTDLVLTQIQTRVAENRTVNLIIHPITQYICDKLMSVERIIKFIGSQSNGFYSELPMGK